MKIKVKRVDKNASLPTVLKKGDWFDITVPHDIHLEGPTATVLKRVRKKDTEEVATRRVEFHHQLIDLGFVMELPAGYEAHILPRSSAFHTWGFIFPNSIGIIDNSYRGPNDTWKANLLPFRTEYIGAGSRIAQFKVVLSQKATIWQKIKHLFVNKIEFVEVETFDTNVSRGGIGSTGKS